MRPWLRLEPKTPSPQVFTALTVVTQAIITREGLPLRGFELYLTEFVLSDIEKTGLESPTPGLFRIATGGGLATRQLYERRRGWVRSFEAG